MKRFAAAAGAAILLSIAAGAQAQSIAELRAQLAQTREMIRQAEAAGMDAALLQSLRDSMNVAEQAIREMEADQAGSAAESHAPLPSPIRVEQVRPVYVNSRQRTPPPPPVQRQDSARAEVCIRGNEVVWRSDTCGPAQAPTAPEAQHRGEGKGQARPTSTSGKPHIIVYWGDSQSGSAVRVIDQPNASAVADQQMKAKGPGAWVKYLESTAPGYGAAMCKGDRPNVRFYVVHGYSSSRDAITAAQNEARADGPGLTYLCSYGTWHLD